ncbi:hypothetical protein BRADI_2g05107v3 [Brachypodium distachyon]|uniref:DUF3615 domain-containing protein n=1 Tax=Brachypodium distachyon TaxID=15368 RepID=A0A0Q3IRN3_BRADI|nr:hypothetical protein BRADI_2g05107v3 [Brachypodium distachyon]
MADKEETRPLVGVGPAPPGPLAKTAEISEIPPVRPMIEAGKEAEAEAEESCRLRGFGRKPRPLAGDGPAPPRTREARAQIEGVSHEIVLQCLEWYNSNHPGDEYEPAPGRVTRYTIINNLRWWTHGNFVARRKRSGSGCFSFLPAQRTLFFFELTAGLDCIDQVVTCAPLDEPVTEAYKFLGFRLGCGTRRDGGSDCVCKTCHRQFLLPDPFMTRTCACGGKVERLCHMCYPKCIVLHPLGGEFEFGHHKDNVWKAHLDHA